MHETGLVLSMLEIAEREARAAGATRIVAIHMRVGAMSSVVPEAFAHAFDIFRAGTMAGDAELAFERVPANWYCTACGQMFTDG
jgi:hydrogenase nickel incorporation protein HypA/HybF